MFWTPCTAHCINLMLQDLGDKLPTIKSALREGGYYLNPSIFYKNDLAKMESNKEIKIGLFKAIQKLVDEDALDSITSELVLYRSARGSLGSTMAMRAGEKVAPIKFPCQLIHYTNEFIILHFLFS
ncbi:unnamed protein product [Cuscuta europaea]|uniref:DUF659 domain-containing protein n=1 Tax=Cuscuta europaea TaxID=41803 RepID=A0A9P1E9L0_CUSEU|nr:unnamed protein product [Cuscuta europaea]